MIKSIIKWFFYTILSGGIGFLLGFVLLWSWSILTLIFIRYSDSGPPWINTINDILFYGGIVIVIIGGQLIYLFKEKNKH
jgi:hypothetical protein